MYSLVTCSLIKYVFYNMQNSLCKMQNTLGKNMPNKICQTQFSTPHAQPCNLLSDTICGSRSELQMLDEQRDDDEVYDNMYDADPDEEAILHYEAPTEKEDDEEEVFGERRTEERQKDGNSPTRDILKYRMRERGDLRSLKKATLQGGLDVVGDGLETHSDYGQPAFFEEEEDPGERNQVVDQAERPIVDVVRRNLIVQTNSHLKISGETVPHDQLDIVSRAEAGGGQVDPKREEKPRHDDEVEGDDEDLVGQGDHDLVEGEQPVAKRWKRHTRLPSRTGVASRGGGHEHKEGEEHHL